MIEFFKKIYIPVIFFLVVQNYVSSEFFWILGLVFALYYLVISNRCILTIPYKEIKILTIFLIWGFVIGFVGIVCEEIRTIDFIRDIFYYTYPIIFMYIGMQYADKDIDIYRILNSFILASGILSIIRLINVMQNFSVLMSASSVHDWRLEVGESGVVMGVAIALVFSGFIPHKKRMPKVIYLLSTITSITFFVISLSRTNIFIVAIIYIILVVNQENQRNVIIRVIGMIALIVFGIYILNAFLPSDIVNDYTEKFLSTFTEINSATSFDTATEIQENWRGYEAYCAFNQWKTVGIFKQIFGGGFGTRIEVGKYAYLYLGQMIDGYPATSIAVLHNGYATQLIKLGAFGVILYVWYYLVMIRKGMRAIRNSIDRYGRLLMAVSAELLFQTYFLNGLYKDYCFYPMIILIGYCAYKIEREERITGYEDEI